jgi:hypothetical protein
MTVFLFVEYPCVCETTPMGRTDGNREFLTKDELSSLSKLYYERNPKPNKAKENVLILLTPKAKQLMPTKVFEAQPIFKSTQ